MADLFLAVGPDRPTLCEGWDTGDLLTHLLIRERRGDTVLSQAVPPLRSWAKSVWRSYHHLPWNEQVHRLRSGPPWYNPISLRPVDTALNTGEFFIHHEDIRRGEPGWTPRTLDEQTTEALVKQIKSPFSKWQLRKFQGGVRVEFPGQPVFELVAGDDPITLAGEPGEIVLWISGRRRACEVDVTGSPEALAVLERGHS